MLLDSLEDGVVFTKIAYSEPVSLTRVRKNYSRVARRVLSKKTRAWNYEREWRMIAPRTRKHFYTKKCVERVILGSRMATDVKARVQDELKAKDIPTESLAVESLTNDA